MGRSIREGEEQKIMNDIIKDSTLVYRRDESRMGAEMVAFVLELMSKIENLINESGESLTLNAETREAYLRIAGYLRQKADDIEMQMNED